MEIHAQNSGIHSQKSDSNHYFGVDSTILREDFHSTALREYREKDKSNFYLPVDNVGCNEPLIFYCFPIFSHVPRAFEKMTLRYILLLSCPSSLNWVSMFGQALAQWRAFSLAVARSSRLHSFSRSGHLSRCCMVCSEVPHSQAVSAVSAYSPIYSSWFLLRPIPVRSLLRDFHSFHWPGASCSPVGIGSFARCCLAIRCSSHNASLAAWGGCDSGWTAWWKLFLDFRRLGAGWWLWQGWRVSSACLLRLLLLATDLRTPGGAIPVRTYRLSTFVGLRQPVMHLQLSLREASTFFAWDDLSHTGQAYSATE